MGRGRLRLSGGLPVLESSIARNDVPNRTAKVGPFDINGDVKQGYLFKFSTMKRFPFWSS